MTIEHKTVFISYRRNVASFIARAIFIDLRLNGYDVFMDVANIDNGTFDTIILNQIEARAHFLIILTPGTLERCAEQGDWLRREIEYAIQKERNIVPLFVNDFKFGDTTRMYLTGDLAQLSRFNGLNLPHDFFDEAMKRLRERFLKQPAFGKIKPTPSAEQPIVEKKIEEVAAQPRPTKEELSAEDYVNRGLARNEQDYDGKIADYSEAVRLNSRYIIAYNNRGNTRHDKGDFAGALADYNEAIRLNPQYAIAYNNRGNVLYDMGDLDSALRDFSEAIKLNPQDVTALNNRGVAYDSKGEINLAIDDYSEALRLNPQYAIAYGNRGEAYFAIGEFDKALKDFREANNLKPAYNMTLGGLAITHFSLSQKSEAKRLWRVLIAQDQRYLDADWIKKELDWADPLIEAVRKLIAEL